MHSPYPNSPACAAYVSGAAPDSKPQSLKSNTNGWRLNSPEITF
jgi:hypothetical protein